jgi:tRNA threonylcarbamoyladenosine biosynthesis protein TsaB
MKIFALELSTQTGSLAILDGTTVLFEKEWVAEGRQLRPIFPDLHALASNAGWEWSAIDQFAVGVGPGAFSGLRMAVAGIRALALPDAKPVMAVSSASAVASAMFEETDAEQVVVLGDARRNELWAGCFRREQGMVTRQGDWIVTGADQLPALLDKPGAVWVSSDWERIQDSLKAVCPAGVVMIPEARYPRATMVARVVAQRVKAGLEGEPLSPIYVHPAVSIAPRF